MFGDVNVKVEDGNLGRSSSTGTGTSIKIGISNVESKSPISKKAVEDAKERFKSSFVSYGKMVIYTYLPKELLPESFEDLTFEEFFELYGQADCAREMRIEDIETGVAKGIADNFSNDE